MRVVFRADAAHAIGTGHVMRCLTLAGALQDRGAAVTFVCRSHKGHLCDLIEERGFSVNRLLAPGADVQSDQVPVHAAWLGAPWEEDVAQTRAAIDDWGIKPDWLVVDHYAIDRRWESSMRTSVTHILAIDDLADRQHDCDLLLDQNLVGRMHTRYCDKVPVSCGLLLGPKYALLQHGYSELRERTLPRKGNIRRIFIFFGGADLHNVTARSLDAFLGLRRPDIAVDVVVTAGSPTAQTLCDRIAGHENISLHSGLNTLAPLMAAADLAIGAAGATSWERICLGLPTLVVTLAQNQRPIAEELHARGLVNWLGYQDEVDTPAIARELGKLFSRGLDGEWSRRCLGAVDGRGVERVCKMLAVTSSENR